MITHLVMNDVIITSSLGVLLIRSDQWQKAISVFRQLSRLYPEDEPYRKQIALLEEALEKQQKSQDAPEQPDTRNIERETSSKESLSQPAAHNSNRQSLKQPDIHMHSEQGESAI